MAETQAFDYPPCSPLLELVMRYPDQLGIICLPRWAKYALLVKVLSYFNGVPSLLIQGINQFEPLQPPIRDDVQGQ